MLTKSCNFCGPGTREQQGGTGFMVSQSNCHLGCSHLKACLGLEGPAASSLLENSRTGRWQEASVPTTWMSPWGYLRVLTIWWLMSLPHQKQAIRTARHSLQYLCPRLASHAPRAVSHQVQPALRGVSFPFLKGGVSKALGHILKPPCPPNLDKARSFTHWKNN